jgi:hypothetical protein
MIIKKEVKNGVDILYVKKDMYVKSLLQFHSHDYTKVLLPHNGILMP